MRPLLAALGLLALVLPGLAPAQTVTLVADRPVVALGGSATIEVVVEGGTGIAGNPTFPRSDGFTVAFAGQSSSFQMARGSVSQSITFQYRLTGRTIGDWTVGPAEVNVGGQTLKTAALDMKVVKGGGASTSAGAAAPAGAQHYARAEVSDATPYVGEAFTWILEVGSSGRVRQPSLPSLPDFGGLSSEPGIEPQWTSQRVMRDGRRLEVFVAALPVFAVEPGDATIGAAVVSLPEVMDGRGMFARVRELQLDAKAVPVAVRPLPPNRPPDYSGAVGRFSLVGAVDSTTVEAGETVTLTLRLDGQGALRAPEVTLDLPDSVRVYDEDPETAVTLVDGAVHSRSLFRKALVPLEPGTLTLPPARFTYLDPETGTYQVARSKPLRIQVTGEAVAEPDVARSEGIATDKEAVEILASDILPLRTGERLLGRQGFRPTSPLILALLLLPLLGFGGALSLTLRERNAGSARGQQAARTKEAKAAARRAKEAGASGDLDEADGALRDWLSARMERSGASLSPTEAESTLTTAGAPGELASRLATLLARVEGVRYGGEPAGSLAADLAAWVADAHKEWT